MIQKKEKAKQNFFRLSRENFISWSKDLTHIRRKEMKQMMKKLMVTGVMTAMMISVSVQAENTVKNFVKGKDALGGFIDNEIIFIYKDKKVGNEKGVTALSLLKHLAKSKICEKKDTRTLVEDLGMSVKFIYLNKEDATIVKIDNCKGVTTKTKRKGEV